MALTISEHQESIRAYLKLRTFNAAVTEIEGFLLNEAYLLELTLALTSSLREFLRTHRILEPSPDTMYRLIQAQRETTRTEIYNKVVGVLSDETKEYLDALLNTDDETYSPLHTLKKPPGNPSPPFFIKLTEIMDKIQDIGIISCIIYCQAKEIHRVIQTYTPPENIDLSLLSNISPASRENIILYGDYILNRNRVRR